MKNTQLIIILFALSLGLSGCTDWLSIRPEGETVLQDFWKSESQATSELASCYKGLSNYDCMQRMLVWGEVRSDNVMAGTNPYADLTKVLNFNISPTNAYADWSSFYAVINYCNTFLYFAPTVMNSDPNFTASKLHALEAEALAVRALCYFYLVRTYKEVPLVLTPSINDTQDYTVAKSTERQILDQIIADLLVAQKNARTDYGKGAYNKGRFTKNGVNALLADVYLWDQQYANCVEACNNVLNDNSLSLVDGQNVIPEVFYKGNSTESIFELQFDKDVQYNYLVDFMYGYAGTDNNLGQLCFPAFLAATKTNSPFSYSGSAVKESEKDIRGISFFGTTGNGANGNCIYKYALSDCSYNSDQTAATPTYRSPAYTTNWIVYRLSDVILMKAEALVQLGSNDNLKEAMQMVNITYLRSNLTDSLQFSNYGDKGTMEKLVLRERQRELMFEGKRWFDLMRLARRNDDASAISAYISPKMTGDGLGKNKMSVMDALYMPISKSELEVNKNLVQNQFYLSTNSSN